MILKPRRRKQIQLDTVGEKKKSKHMTGGVCVDSDILFLRY